MSAYRFFLIFIGKLFIYLALPLAIIFLLAVPATGFVWDIANALGYICVGLFLLLYIYTGRTRVFPPFSGHFFTRFHRDLGYAALILLVLHIGILLISEPKLIEHLKLTAPLYMLSGLIAAIFILLLIISSLTKFRSQLWSSYGVFKRVHKWGSVVIAGLIGFHLVGSHFYLNNVWKGIFLLIIVLGVLSYYSNQKTKAANTQARVKNNKNASTLTTFALIIVLVIISLLMTLYKSWEL